MSEEMITIFGWGENTTLVVAWKFDMDFIHQRITIHNYVIVGDEGDIQVLKSVAILQSSLLSLINLKLLSSTTLDNGDRKLEYEYEEMITKSGRCSQWKCDKEPTKFVWFKWSETFYKQFAEAGMLPLIKERYCDEHAYAVLQDETPPERSGRRWVKLETIDAKKTD